MNTAVPYPNAPQAARARAAQGKLSWPPVIAMLAARTLLFAAIQSLIALVLAAAGTPDAFRASAAWWPIVVTLTNLVCVFLLDRLARREGIRLVDIYRGRPSSFRKEIGWAVLFLFLSGPLAMGGGNGLSTLLFGNAEGGARMMFQPLPLGIAIAGSILFPLTIAFSELPTYAGYGTPRVEALAGKAWLGVMLPGLMLSIQHAALPLIFDLRFFLWRLVMYLPFALYVILVLRWRPQLMPYFMVGHFLIDLATAPFIIMAAQGTF